MLFRVDFKSGFPVSSQVAAQIKAAAASGALRPGEALPAIGTLAEELRVGRNSVAKAYAEVEGLGIIELAPGGTYRLKENHRQLRKEVARAADASAAQEPGRQRKSLVPSLPGWLAFGACLALAGALSAAMVKAAVLRGESASIMVSLLLTALLLPLHPRMQRVIERQLFPKRHSLKSALDSLKAEAWTQPDLEAFLGKVIDAAEKI